MRKALAEFLGTFAIVFAGTGAIVINQASGGAIGHVGISLVFGMVVTAMIHCFGETSGAHLNPAVTLAFAAARRFPWTEVPRYLLSQVLGGLSASLLLRILFPDSPTLGETLPAGPAMQSFLLEVILALLLMLVILSLSSGSKEQGMMAGISIGCVIGLEAMFAGPICGASMNPARSLAPAIVGGNMTHLWLYLLAPVSGALLAIPLWRLVREPQPPEHSL